MRVIVRIDAGCRPALQRWGIGLSTNPIDRQALGRVYMDELMHRLVTSGGYPVGFQVEPGTTPPRLWAELSGGAWVQYTIADSGYLFNPSRTILLLNCQPHQPLGAIPGSRPS